MAGQVRPLAGTGRGPAPRTQSGSLRTGTRLAPFPNETLVQPGTEGPVMASKRSGGQSDRPKEVSLDEMLENRRIQRPGSAADPSTRDGDSSRGNVNETDADTERTDNDVGDDADADLPLAGPAGGAVGGTPARGRAT